MKLRLLNNGGKSWKQFENAYIKGFAFVGGRLLWEEKLEQRLIAAIEKNKLSDVLKECNGNFSAVIFYHDEIYLISDKLKTYPLLYFCQNQEWIITDQAEQVLSEYKYSDLDEGTIAEFLVLGYLHDNRTFLKECKIVQCGTYVKLKPKGRIEICEYHGYVYQKVKVSPSDFTEHAKIVLEDSFQRFIKTISEKQIAIPLSGGYDSRLIACLCKKYGLQNVICYTYGDRNSLEVSISEKVAKSLGFPWYYVEYTEDKIESFWNSLELQKYCFFSMNLNTLSHVQDFIAFRELRQKGIISEYSIIVPGHSGDIFAGSHIPYSRLDQNVSAAQLILEKYYNLNPLKDLYWKQVKKESGLLTDWECKNDKDTVCDKLNNWNIRNRQSNFIINAVRVYEYFGNDWRLPLWDDDYAAFWLSLEWENRTYWYDKFMFDHYFIPQQVDFYKSANKQHQYAVKLKLPYDLKTKIKFFLCDRFNFFRKRYDPNNSNLVLKVLLEKMKNDRIPYIKYKSFKINAVIVLFQLLLLRNKMNRRS